MINLKGKKGLEIGGPSEIFYSDDYKVYKNVDNLDGINIPENYWQNEIYSNFLDMGNQYYGDACDENFLESINKKYDFLLISHVIEHIANPIRSIHIWKKYLLKDEHYIISIIPDKSLTFDRLRNITTLKHLEEDFKNEITESDDTHINEAIFNFDSTWGGDYESYKILGKDNFKNRLIHHHCFDKKLVEKMFQYCGYEIIEFFQKDFNIFHVFRNNK